MRQGFAEALVRQVESRHFLMSLGQTTWPVVKLIRMPKQSQLAVGTYDFFQARPRFQIKLPIIVLEVVLRPHLL